MTDLQPVWTPEDFADTVADAQAVSEYATITAEMRVAAELLEQFSRLYAIKDPAAGEWSANLLRAEADYLDRPIPGE